MNKNMFPCRLYQNIVTQVIQIVCSYIVLQYNFQVMIMDVCTWYILMVV